jgi:hypothetical protein
LFPLQPKQQKKKVLLPQPNPLLSDQKQTKETQLEEEEEEVLAFVDQDESVIRWVIERATTTTRIKIIDSDRCCPPKIKQ